MEISGNTIRLERKTTDHLMAVYEEISGWLMALFDDEGSNAPLVLFVYEKRSKV
jgi:hypothetical protein